MRILAGGLLLALVVRAQDEPRQVDPFVTALQIYIKARGKVLEPGGHAQVFEAVDGMVATRDPRAVGHLAQFLVETMALERATVEQSKKRQLAGLRAHDRKQVLERELNRLRLKEKAGDTSVGAEIQKRLDERRRQSRVFDDTKAQVGRLGKQVDLLVDLRERLATACATLLANLERKDVPGAMTQLRRVFDIAEREQALFLVRILREGSKPEAEDHLLEILSHPRSDEAVQRSATYALLPVLTRRGGEAVLAIWDREPDQQGARARHLLSLAAGRILDDREAARAWVATLK